MSLEFITSPHRWNEIFALLPDFAGKIYYSHSYYATMQANGDGQAAALLYCQNTLQEAGASKSKTPAITPDLLPDSCGAGEKLSNIVFYPFLLKPIPAKIGGDGYFDLETAYGYGGPMAFACDSTTLRSYAEQFANWAQQQNIVAEFVRFNPLFANQDNFADFYKISHNRITVSIPLKNDFASILQNCTPARQRNYRRALREGLIFRQLPDISNFCELYAETMHRLDADRYYFFSPACFKALAEIPETNRFFAGVYTPAGQLAASGIFLLDERSAHYHLGASDQKYKDLQANAFMMLEFAKMAAQSKKQLLHLGGGLSLADDDQLFRFKAGFANNRHDFFIGRKIHRPDFYQTLSTRWQQLTGASPEILLHYHYGANNANL